MEVFIMKKYVLTLGLNDRYTKKQKFDFVEAHGKLNRILLVHFEIYAFTMIDCYGCYRHKNGEIVQECSIRIEIADEENKDDTIRALIRALKHKRCFNQESIMLEVSEEDITFR